MSDDLISKEKAYKVLTKYYHHKTEMQHKALREALDMVPSAELQPTCNQLATSCNQLATDCISRQAAIDALKNVLVSEELEYAIPVLEELPSVDIDLSVYSDKLWRKAYDQGKADAEPRWIPVKTRPMDEEERKHYLEELGWSLDDNEAVMFDSLMPGDGQEVWVCSKCGNVWQDTCEIDEGIGLEENGDWLDIVAWMPFERPEPWKGEGDG